MKKTHRERLSNIRRKVMSRLMDERDFNFNDISFGVDNGTLYLEDRNILVRFCVHPIIHIENDNFPTQKELEQFLTQSEESLDEYLKLLTL